jgi:hypothetical protein
MILKQLRTEKKHKQSCDYENKNPQQQSYEQTVNTL